MISGASIAANLLRAAASCNSLRPSVLPEIAAFANGGKPALRFVVGRRDAIVLESAAKAAGLSTQTKKVFLVQRGNGWNEIVHYPTEISQSLIAISHDDRCSHLIEAELTDMIEAGLILGYPKCCVQALASNASAPESWALAHLNYVERIFDARLNRFAAEWGGIGLIGELFPCTLQCSAAAQYAQSLYDSMIHFELHQLANAAKSDALAPVNISKLGRISRAKKKGTVEFYW